LDETPVRHRDTFDDVDPLPPVAIAVMAAAAGLALGYLFLTPQGRQLRARLEPTLELWIDELRTIRGAADKARTALDEGKESWAAVRSLASR
jgi:hypothetical protein